ncbi:MULTISPECIES: phosphorylcholine transferase LicD [Paenibacillus]|uniref:LicD family protein n=1 Tax=Paenibacillus TaxID=44249 RepID=UPI00168A9429|nr:MULTISPECIES: LicD family protein [Paenibacillus]
MIQIDKEALRRIQLIQLEMLIEVDRICRICGIRYQIIAGTMLGAIRHGGYIPWDDDADVALLRSEYEKFRKACLTELDTSRFYFQDHRNTPGYRWGYGKLRRKDSLFLREYQEHMPYEQGIFIDIFPLDGTPDMYPVRVLHNLKCFCVRKTLWSAVGRFSEPKLFVRLLYRFLSGIPEEWALRRYEKLIVRSNRKRTTHVRILMFPTPNRTYGYKRSWYENSTPVMFENHMFQGIQAYEEYLTFKFGDYMILPPESKRKVHPVSALVVPKGEK